MRRRDFVTLLGTAAALPVAGLAQSTKKVPVVGVLWHAANEQEEAPFLEPFRTTLHELGYTEGKNVALEQRFPAERPEFFLSMARDLVERRVDVLVAVSPLAAAVAKRATSTIPIVFVVHPNPVAAGIVSSLARPGGNITGLSSLIVELSAKQIELLREMMPGLKRIAVLVMPTFGPVGPQYFDEAAAACLAVIRQNASKIDGVKMSLLDADREIQMRLDLPPGGVNAIRRGQTVSMPADLPGTVRIYAAGMGFLGLGEIEPTGRLVPVRLISSVPAQIVESQA